MQKFPPRRALSLLLLSGLLPLTACDAPEATEVQAPHLFSSVSDASVLECPTAITRSAEKLVLPFGGTVSLDGNSVVVPLGALLGAARIEIQVPASRHIRVDLRANNREHWQFRLPVVVTLDYSRCPSDALGAGPLSVWHIDSRTGELLENMGGTDDRLLQRITFVTDHFSGYAIAN